MFFIVGSFRVPPEAMDAARPAMAKMIAASRAEPGCAQYGYAEDVLEPGLFHVTERWRDRDSLSGHFTAPHLVEWRAEWRRLGFTERQLTLYETDGGEPI
ncbi:putative quinol monooxygenase [Sphingomonas sp.]|uniref:putative quinol monooxygenase n=1 Tax=Sphingomonas sp. TaxID=28214 RepID=UPI001B06B3C4|nr:putative quinol monooxygenase [Sphingomonas sp.]MBO9714048.1 antibiotic biosynthesis monooxygenase [Sphingomonas sp.]